MIKNYLVGLAVFVWIAVFYFWGFGLMISAPDTIMNIIAIALLLIWWVPAFALARWFWWTRPRELAAEQAKRRSTKRARKGFPVIG